MSRTSLKIWIRRWRRFSRTGFKISNRKVRKGCAKDAKRIHKFLTPVSNWGMRGRIASLTFVLFSCSLWAQQPLTNKEEEASIERVKTLQASSLDPDLPKVPLEFFLEYEGEGAPIKWGMSNCDQFRRNPATDPKREPTVCVKAEIDLKDNRSVTVIVSFGTPKPRPGSVPTVLSVTVTDQGGIHDVRRLSDLPMELHRPLPKSPRDLPLPAGAA